MKIQITLTPLFDHSTRPVAAGRARSANSNVGSHDPTLKPERRGEFQAPAGFALQGSESLRYALTIEGQDGIADLLAMTPQLYRATADGCARAAALSHIPLTVDVRLTCCTRQAAG